MRRNSRVSRYWVKMMNRSPSFTTGGGGNQEFRAVLIPKPLSGLNLVVQRPAFDGRDLVRAVNLRQFDAQKLQGLAILGEDDEPLAIIHAAQTGDHGEQAVKLAVGAFGDKADEFAH